MKHASMICAALCFASAAQALAAPKNFDWSGPYGGLNAGGAFGTSDLKTSVGTGNTYFFNQNKPGIASTGSQTVHPSELIGGGQIGVNGQHGQVVYGIEGDLDAFDLSGSKTSSAEYTSNPTPNGTYVINQSVKTSWLATLCPRIGVANGNTLVYVTGGVAFTDLRHTGSFTDTEPTNESASRTTDVTGTALGGGISFGLRNNWSVSAEYIYVNFPTTSTTGTFVVPNDAGTAVLNHTANVNASILRLDLNRKF